MSHSGSQPEFAKDFSHLFPNSLIALIQGRWIDCWLDGLEVDDSASQWLHNSLPQHHERAHHSQTLRSRFVAPTLADKADHVFPAELLQIVGRLTGPVVLRRGSCLSADMIGERRGTKAVRCCG